MLSLLLIKYELCDFINHKPLATVLFMLFPCYIYVFAINASYVPLVSHFKQRRGQMLISLALPLFIYHTVPLTLVCN